MVSGISICRACLSRISRRVETHDTAYLLLSRQKDARVRTPCRISRRVETVRSAPRTTTHRATRKISRRLETNWIQQTPLIVLFRRISRRDETSSAHMKHNFLSFVVESQEGMKLRVTGLSLLRILYSRISRRVEIGEDNGECSEWAEDVESRKGEPPLQKPPRQVLQNLEYKEGADVLWLSVAAFKCLSSA